MAAYSVLPHSVAYLIERGFDPLVAASAFGLAGMLSAIGILAVGWLSDRFGRLHDGHALLPLDHHRHRRADARFGWPSLALVYAFVLFFGLMQGARGPIIVALVARLFPGRRRRHLRHAVVAHGLGAGLGSWGSGLLYELTGSYIASFVLADLRLPAGPCQLLGRAQPCARRRHCGGAARAPCELDDLARVGARVSMGEEYRQLGRRQDVAGGAAEDHLPQAGSACRHP